MNQETYLEHYSRCIDASNPETPDATGGLSVVKDLHVTEACSKDQKKYAKLLHTLREKVDHLYSTDENSFTTNDFSLEVNNPLVFPETLQILDLFYDFIKEEIYGCHFTTNTIQIYRNYHSDSEKESSWLWHYDDNPEPQLKLFIYLSDVTDESAPFTYLRDKHGQGRKIETSRISPTKRLAQQFHASRIPQEVVDQYTLFSYEEYSLCGGPGTAFIFDPNIIHKATVPSKGKSRDVLVYHIHPSLHKKEFLNLRDTDVKRYDYE